MLLGTCLRMLATLPPYEGRLAPRTKFWLVFAANMMVNTGHPVLITMSTKVGGKGRGMAMEIRDGGGGPWFCTPRCLLNLGIGWHCKCPTLLRVRRVYARGCERLDFTLGPVLETFAGHGCPMSIDQYINKLLRKRHKSF